MTPLRGLAALSAATATALATTAFTTALTNPADATTDERPATSSRTKPTSPYFDNVGTFFLTGNLRGGEEQQTTAAEIMAFDKTGRTLVYTDPFTSRLGFVDSTDPSNPQPAGALDLPGDPTSVAIFGGYALVAVVTSQDPDGNGPLNELDAPSGDLLVVRLSDRTIVRTIPLGGQPDSVSVAPSKDYVAIVIENQRDEAENGGLIPQSPPGLLQVLKMSGGSPAGWSLSDVDLTGLADVAPQDPEPEFVDINSRDRAVVSMQENNHLAVVNLRNGKVVNDFSAGTTDVQQVDTVEDDNLTLDGSLTDRRREPDSVHWIDDNTFATANEGDYEDANGEIGGTRSFTLWNVNGKVEYEAGNRFEREVVRVGQYPESRSENKGSEPEGLEVTSIGGRTYLFVGSERANVVGVYQVVDGKPRFRQILPTGIGPEGLLTKNRVLAVSGEVDGLADGFPARPFISLYEVAQRTRPAYPMLASGDDRTGSPIPWIAQSSLAGDAKNRNVMWSVSDSYLAQAYLYKIDVSGQPARIVKRIPVGAADGSYDLEGVASRREGGSLWLASEGNADGRTNKLLEVRRNGTVVRTVELPSGLEAGATSNGFEGVAVTGRQSRGNEVVYVAQQRAWADDEPGFTKIGRYDVAKDEWTFAAYRLDTPTSPAGGWVGVSELTPLPGGRLAVVERDNQLGQEARIKRLYGIDPRSVDFAPFGDTLPVLEKTRLRNLLPKLDAASISVPDKIEGFGRTRDGRYFGVTDNDGVEENYGETVFVRFGLPGLSG